MENNQPNHAGIITGADSIGFCINLATASGPTDSVQRIIMLDTDKGREIEKNGIKYLVPDNESVIDSINSDIDFSMFSSKTEFSNHMSAETSADASGWGFTGEFKAAYSKISKGQSSSMYGLVEAHATLWETKIQQLETVRLAAGFAEDLDKLPAQFTLDTQAGFFDFFNKYGTHVITSAFAGGQLNYYISVTGSSSFTEEKASAQMKVEYESVFVEASAEGKASWEKMDKSWIASRKGRLSVVGGQPDIIMGKAIPPTDPTKPVNYKALVDAWSKGVTTSPSITGVKVQSLAKLVPVNMIHAVNAALVAYLNAEVAADCMVKYEYPGGTWPVVAGAGYSIQVGQKEIPMPHQPTSPQQGNYWIVLADSRGHVHFNKNILSSGLKADSHYFDELIAEAKAASPSGNDWVALVVNTNQVSAPSVSSLQWLKNCGIDISIWTADAQAYASAPFQFTAVGRANSPKFAGNTSATDIWAVYTHRKPHLVEQKAELPLFINMTALKANEANEVEEVEEQEA
jgi:hypothetical protein